MRGPILPWAENGKAQRTRSQHAHKPPFGPPVAARCQEGNGDRHHTAGGDKRRPSTALDQGCHKKRAFGAPAAPLRP